MRWKTLVAIGTFFATTALQAQVDFRPGYVLSYTGDTLSGEIDYRGDALMSTVCRFRTSEGAAEKVYAPDDIRAYRFTDGKYYITKVVEGKNKFLEYLVNGELSVYYMRDQSDHDRYFLGKDTVLTEMRYQEAIIQRDGKNYYTHSSWHINLLKLYTQDAPSLQANVEAIQKPDHASLIKLAKRYHATVCNGEQCLVYEKRVPFLKANPEVVVGLVHYQRPVVRIQDKNYLELGVLLHVWMPRSNEKLYFRTGLLHARLQRESSTLSYYKIPFQLEYIYPKSRIRPKAAAGVNFYSPFYQTVAVMGGLQAQLSSRVYWSVNYDIDFTSSAKMPLFPEKMFSHDLQTGLFFRL
ncbi:hypothetical protein SAMN05421823_101440 [Catalinimonas alkaloidigena]|uniref:Outer membrane protein beta-barrel domain-containing protein n=1 Tax=Catalinimonas alkaloidigena TaxID=1075417 RepID=A0A1G8XPW4_9BACT|nr:hypothetical protein [Catalinimonas alkaloidigena]SDJ92619.1 hypothetical protein SAMN05421823_101440 [Catalinimonas alkaloidigena]